MTLTNKTVIELKLKLLAVALFITLLLSACHGYKFLHDPQECSKTINVSPILADTDGFLMSQIVKKISSQSPLKYSICQPDFLLKVEVDQQGNKNIGYRYDVTRKDKLKKALIPTESRYILIATATLIDLKANQIVSGPTKITATLDYDFDYYKIQDNVNVFSLGQVSDFETAKDSVKNPLYSKLADLIVEFIISCC